MADRKIAALDQRLDLYLGRTMSLNLVDKALDFLVYYEGSFRGLLVTLLLPL